MYNEFKMSKQLQTEYSKMVGRKLSRNECESMYYEIKELEDYINYECEDEPFTAYKEGIKEILSNYR